MLEEKFGKSHKELYNIRKITYNNDGTVKDSSLYDKNGELEDRGLLESINSEFPYEKREKTIAKYTFEYDEKSQLIAKIPYSSNGSIFLVTKYKYDFEGNMLELNEYRWDGKLMTKRICRYNENGNWMGYVTYDQHGQPLGKGKYEYDSNNKHIRSIFYKNDDSINFSVKKIYNSDGKVIETQSFDENGKMDEKTLSKRDNQGNVINRVTYRNEDISTNSSYKYDDLGNRIESSLTLYDSDNSIIGQQTSHKYYYNEDGTISTKLFGHNDTKFGENKFFPTIEDTYEYLYESDIDDNW